VGIASISIEEINISSVILTINVLLKDKILFEGNLDFPSGKYRS
jgi:hypothetical protein